MARLKKLVACLLLLSANAGALQDGIKWSDVPEATDYVRDVVGKAAPITPAAQGLQAAYDSGEVEIYPGVVPGARARAWPQPDGTGWIIVVQWNKDQSAFWWGILHEWAHISQGHPLPLTPGGPPTPQTPWPAPPTPSPTNPGAPGDFSTPCLEWEAHCIVLGSIAHWVGEYGYVVYCEYLQVLLWEIGWEKWLCENPDFIGPSLPDDDPCGFGEIPCGE